MTTVHYPLAHVTDGDPTDRDSLTTCCGLRVGDLPQGQHGHLVVPVALGVDRGFPRVCAGRCHRCGRVPGRERWYVPGEPGRVGFSLAGAQTKVSAKRTVGCDECWQKFLALRDVPVRSCCGLRHEGAECPDGLTMCALCFERVPRRQLHVLPDGSVEDVCASCAEREAVVTAVVGLEAGGATFAGEVHLLPFWRDLPEWVVWLALWLLGCALVVVGGGWQGFLSGVGLLVSGAGMGLLVRYLLEKVG